VHLGEHLLGEGLGDAVEVDLAAGLADALGLGLGELLDVAIGGVLESKVLVVSFEEMVEMRLDCSMIDRPPQWFQSIDCIKVGVGGILRRG
jgi:hypothetical protein